MSFSLLAQEYDVTISFNPNEQFYNVLRVASFDTQAPQNQPTFFRVSAVVNNPVSQPDLHYSLKMDSVYLIDPGTRARFKGDLSAGTHPNFFTNRDVFAEGGSDLFEAIDPISVSQILDNVPHLRDVILNTGLFPDGRYIFTAQFFNRNTSDPVSNEAEFRFTVRNPGGIFLISPGVALGGRIPQVSSMPLNFIWSSNLARGTDNPFLLTVKEFDDPYLLSSDFIETEGQVVAEEIIEGSNFFSEYLPLKEGRYYAWQVTSFLHDPTVSTPPVIKSPFYVFQYSTDAEYDNKAAIEAIRLYLLSLNIQWITELLNQGFDPSGILNYDGSVLSGPGAEALINQLKNRQVIETRRVD
jgi:hypothetical protein